MLQLIRRDAKPKRKPMNCFESFIRGGTLVVTHLTGILDTTSSPTLLQELACSTPMLLGTAVPNPRNLAAEKVTGETACEYQNERRRRRRLTTTL